MKNVVKLLAAAAVMTYGVAAWAGEEPYVAYVGDDDSIPDYYISAKLKQFTHPNTNFLGDPTADPPVAGEGFAASRGAIDADEICDPERALGNRNKLIVSGNDGSMTWRIYLPKKPVGNLNITIQCGLLKPNSDAIIGNDAINVCAGESGERIVGLCDRQQDVPGVAGILNNTLPRLTVMASAPEDASLTPFHLTAYRNPSPYRFTLGVDGTLTTSESLQVLDGGFMTRFVQKACMTKSIFVRHPVSGQVNSLAETEFDLEAGDAIDVGVVWPRGHVMDVYCHAQSVSVQGIGDPLTLIDDGE